MLGRGNPNEADILIKVLVVEDSAVILELLLHILGSDPDIEVVGTARDGESAIEAVERLRPHVVTMDIHMPKIDGLEATRRIMETHPTPIVIVSGSSDPDEVANTFEAVEAGALAVLARPRGPGHPQHEATAQELRNTVKLMSEVRVVRRWARIRREPAAAALPRRALESAPAGIELVAIGASTGGPPVLQLVLSALPKDFPLAVVIVQHMAAGFVEGFAGWLAHSSAIPVRLASHGETILPGHAYIAPDGSQMKIERRGRIALTHDPAENGLRPSVSYLFRSVAACYGERVIAGLLSGMGRDGADELKVLRECGAVTFAQDHASSVVHGMPGEAIKLDAAAFVLAPEKIAPLLTSIAKRQKIEK